MSHRAASVSEYQQGTCHAFHEQWAAILVDAHSSGSNDSDDLVSESKGCRTEASEPPLDKRTCGLERSAHHGGYSCRAVVKE
jgi:hypothetical protein